MNKRYKRTITQIIIFWIPLIVIGFIYGFLLSFLLFLILVATYLQQHYEDFKL
jgi:hypothetical protein